MTPGVGQSVRRVPGGFINLHHEMGAHARLRGSWAPKNEMRGQFAVSGFALWTISKRPIRFDAVPLGFVKTATVAECLALLQGVRMARALGAKTVRARTDCLHVVDAIHRVGFPKEEQFVRNAEVLRAEAAAFASFQIVWHPSFHRRRRGDGIPAADLLARQAAGLGERKWRPRRRR